MREFLVAAIRQIPCKADRRDVSRCTKEMLHRTTILKKEMMLASWYTHHLLETPPKTAKPRIFSLSPKNYTIFTSVCLERAPALHIILSKLTG